ncbi:MAG: plastocyanin/azurin family copper-binding protein [Flavobacteriales bacterium]
MKHVATFLLLTCATASQAQVTHQLLVEDDEFNPSTLTINAGDHVHILWDNSVVNDHTFTQVAQSTWSANGNTPLAGGYELGVGTPSPGTDFTITPTATVWYVCEFHADMGMKGVITVLGGVGVEEATAQEHYLLAPNPASSIITVTKPDDAPFSVRFIDASAASASIARSAANVR